MTKNIPEDDDSDDDEDDDDEQDNEDNLVAQCSFVQLYAI